MAATPRRGRRLIRECPRRTAGRRAPTANPRGRCRPTATFSAPTPKLLVRAGHEPGPHRSPTTGRALRGGSGGVGHAAGGSARPVGSPPDPVVVIPSWEYSCCLARRLLAVMARSTLMCRCLRHPDSPRRRYRPATAANDSLVPNHPAFTVTRLGRPVSLSRYTCPSAPPGMPRRRECRAAAAAVTDPVENVRDCSMVGVARRGPGAGAGRRVLRRPLRSLRPAPGTRPGSGSAGWPGFHRRAAPAGGS